MRRNLRAVPMFALACAIFVVMAAPAAAQRPLPDLVVSSAAEPPDFIAFDSDFLLSFTVDNQGRASARRTTIARAYLSVGRVLSADDRRRRVGDRRVSPLRAGNSQTRRMVVRIPAQFRQGEYFLIVCADVRNVVDERNDRANCHVSGQKIRIDEEGAAGARGPAGPPGPPGPQGPPGGGADTVQFGRTILDTGEPTVDSVDTSGPFTGIDPNGDTPDEGSTQTRELAKIGPFSVRALCREEAAYADPNDDDEGDEAKLLIYHDGPEGSTMSFEGENGSRGNLPPGEGIAGEEGSDGGEGQHMMLGIFRDPDEGFDPRHDNDNRQPQTFEPPEPGDQEDVEDPGAAGAYDSTSAFVSHSTGWDIVVTGFAGVDVLGAGPVFNDNVDRCVFGGFATIVRRPQGAR